MDLISHVGSSRGFASPSRRNPRRPCTGGCLSDMPATAEREIARNRAIYCGVVYIPPGMYAAAHVLVSQTLTRVIRTD